jgi:hypothetical protein
MESMIGLVGGISVAVTSFLLGLLADFYSERAILFIGSLLGIGISLAYHRLLRPVKLKKNF